MTNSDIMMDRVLGGRYFSKIVDGQLCLCQSVPTGVYDAKGKMTFKDKVVSRDQLIARAAFTDVEYRTIDAVVTQAAARPTSIVNRLLSIADCRRVVDGMSTMTYEYKIEKDIKGVARVTMKLEDDVSGATIDYDEDGVPLPFIFSDFLTNIREDATASKSSGMDTIAQKAQLASKTVAEAQELCVVNGYGGDSTTGFQYRGFKAFGLRNLPYSFISTTPNWNDPAAWGAETRARGIFNAIKEAMKTLATNHIPGPFVLIVPESYKFIFMDDYFRSEFDNSSQSLYMRILETPRPGVPNELDIQAIWFEGHLDTIQNATGAVIPNDQNTEAYIMSLSPEYFNALSTLPPTTFTIDLKGTVATKHRIASGFTPLWRRNAKGKRGVFRFKSA